MYSRLFLIKRYCFSFVLLGFFFSSAQAQNNNGFSQLTYSPLTTAVPFMSLVADAKTGGFGGAGISATANVSAPFFNIAKVSHIEDKYVASLNYTPLLVNLQIDNYALFTFTNSYKMSNSSAFSLFGRYLHIKSFDITNQFGETIGRTTPIQGSIGAGFSTRLNRYLSIGASGKFIYSDLAPNYKPTDGGSGLQAIAVFAGDLGLDYVREIKPDVFLTAGVSISNLGNKVDYTNDGRFNFIPANLGIGVGIKKVLSNLHTIQAGLDINKLLVPTRPTNSNDTNSIKQYYNQSILSSWFSSFSDAQGGFVEELKEITANVGFAYVYRQFLHTRIGYSYQNTLKGNGTLVTLGLTLQYKEFDFDFAYGIPTYSNATYNTSPLANSFRFSLGYRITEE